MKTSIRLVHWKPLEAKENIQLLVDEGMKVVSDVVEGSTFLKELERNTPDALLIDLSRAPSQGRDLAVAVRMRKSTRSIPIVFVAGKMEKVEAIRELLPDAGFTEWEHAASVITDAIRKGVEDPIVPGSVFAAYAKKPLVEKLGIRPGFSVSLVSAPPGFEIALGDLPEEASLIVGVDPKTNLTIWFAHSEDDLQRDLDAIARTSKQAPVWIAWPKRSGAIASDLTQQMVRQRAMSGGMVDYKVCSIDPNWSALLFTWRGKSD
jgi:CheY-like chemotaxis protein